MIEGRVLITGGCGTLGRAIVRTAQREGWNARFTLYSRSELLQAQTRALYPECNYILGDVTDYSRLESAMAGHDLVIHAAAMKRIPESEAQPVQCYQTNVIGSINVVRACMAQHVRRCIGISTDKACRAITAYGASKLAMEKLFQAQTAQPTIFTLVRYGNVVASRGSVLPLWRQQTERGEPITITDKTATRFWMSEDDAVQLIVRGARLVPGELIVPKMGALSLEELAGIVAPGAVIEEIGYRSIEKQHEDLVSFDECVLETPTHFYLRPGHPQHSRYQSDMAPRLSADAFLSMLAIAEAHEEVPRCRAAA